MNVNKSHSDPELETPANQPPTGDAVWSYRGYKLGPSEFTTSMVHLFRAEVSRANVWRQRLDATTNWAVITTGAIISIAFAQRAVSQIVIVLNLFLVTIFLLIEARRYRYYELWSYRVRLMETDFFAAMLVPPFQPSPDWAEALAENMLHPQFTISTWEALGRRLRRNYLYIYTVVLAAWLANIWLIPTPVTSLPELFNRASVGWFRGQWLIFLLILFFLSLILFSLFTIHLQSSTGEVLPRFGDFGAGFLPGLSSNEQTQSGSGAWYRSSRRRAQLLTLIITDAEEAVSQRIIKDMNRGVTRMSGEGMFTHEAHAVLMCALTVTEIPHLKALVAEEDPDAFVIVSPAQEVYGKGFIPLEKKES